MAKSPSPLLPTALALGIALLATLGSLYFSEIAGYQPCFLCWWQRIFMYPQIIILGVGLLRRDDKAWTTALPMAVIGLCIALYHTLIYYIAQFTGNEVLQCTTKGVSCTQQYINWLGFINIPLLSFLAFLGIVLLLAVQSAMKQRTA